MSKKKSAKELSEKLGIPEHKPIVGGTLSRDWLFLLYEALVKQCENHPGEVADEKLGKHKLVIAMFDVLELPGATNHISAGGTVKGSALVEIINALA